MSGIANQTQLIEACALTDIGRIRASNEDAHIIADLSESIRITSNGNLKFRCGRFGALFAVADGMGGAAGGEVASRTAVRILYRELLGRVRQTGIVDPSAGRKILAEAVGIANQSVFERGEREESLYGMGTTLTVVFHTQGEAITGQIGDSRAYLLRGKDIRQLTRDQTVVAEMVAAGLITEEQAKRHPERSMLLQALGPSPDVELVLTRTSVKRNDILLLCSDGLHTELSATEIHEIVARCPTLIAAGRELIAAANGYGGADNVTVVLVRFS